jgi:preprotein translocase subunit YajC
MWVQLGPPLGAEMINPVYASAGAAPAGAGWEQFVFLGIFILIFYFLLIRPQNKRRKEHQALMTGLNKGDEVVTAGGVVGQITKLEDDFVVLQVDKAVRLRFQKSAIGATLPKGTLKSLDEG